MDDINILSSSEEDLVVFDQVVQKFEAQSGFMLSRDKKSKVMGLGKWQDKTDWPLNWIQTTTEVKVLGFVVCPKYQKTLDRTWEVVFRGFEKNLFAWGSRCLVTLQQRVSVVQTFALSKLWYVAQLLPQPNSVIKKMESRISYFVFQGRPERLKLSELENPADQGGLGLTCLATKSENLYLRQSLRSCPGRRKPAVAILVSG